MRAIPRCCAAPLHLTSTADQELRWRGCHRLHREVNRARGCRLVGRHGRRMGGQGAVAFGHHVGDANRELAVKFFFSEDAFRRERDVAQVKVRARARACRRAGVCEPVG